MGIKAVEPSSDTRSRVLDAALACFTELGYEQTTIARIRERSSVSNGALFHHFNTKEAIADALYVDALTSFQVGLWQLLRSQPDSLEAVVRGTIGHQLAWIAANEDRARFLYMRGHLNWSTPAGAELKELNRQLAQAYQDWMAQLSQSAQLRPMPIEVLNAIVTGPTHAIAKRWLAGHLSTPLLGYLDDLSDAVCAALGAGTSSSAARRTPPAALAQRGRIRLELISEDGRVIADGLATAELTPRHGAA